MSSSIEIALTVNHNQYSRSVEPRMLLSDFLRHELHLTGTHVGCEHGVCGACTVLFDGQAVRSCLMFAVQADGHEIIGQDFGYSILPATDDLFILAGQADSTDGDFTDAGYHGGCDAYVAGIALLLESGMGVFRPSAWENWILDRSADSITDFRDHYGCATDKPLIADFNNDGTADRALFRSGEWILDYGIDGIIDGRPRYGMGGDIPLAGHMDGYRLTGVAVFRNGQWIFDYGFDGFTDARDYFGTTGDIPLIGDFNNDGIPDRAVFRASAWENWIIDYNMDRLVNIRDHYGGARDIPVVGDFNRDGSEAGIIWLFTLTY